MRVLISSGILLVSAQALQLTTQPHDSCTLLQTFWDLRRQRRRNFGQRRICNSLHGSNLRAHTLGNLNLKTLHLQRPNERSLCAHAWSIVGSGQICGCAGSCIQVHSMDRCPSSGDVCRFKGHTYLLHLYSSHHMFAYIHASSNTKYRKKKHWLTFLLEGSCLSWSQWGRTYVVFSYMWFL